MAPFADAVRLVHRDQRAVDLRQPAAETRRPPAARARCRPGERPRTTGPPADAAVRLATRWRQDRWRRRRAPAALPPGRPSGRPAVTRRRSCPASSGREPDSRGIFRRRWVPPAGCGPLFQQCVDGFLLTGTEPGVAQSGEDLFGFGETMHGAQCKVPGADNWWGCGVSLAANVLTEAPSRIAMVASAQSNCAASPASKSRGRSCRWRKPRHLIALARDDSAGRRA